MTTDYDRQQAQELWALCGTDVKWYICEDCGVVAETLDYDRKKLCFECWFSETYDDALYRNELLDAL